MIHNMGNVECFELCGNSSKILCSYCFKCWTEGIVYFTCGTCLIPTEFARRLTEERFDALTIPYFVVRKEHAMVLATGKLKHNEGFDRAIRTENRSKPSDGTKIPADDMTRSRVRTTSTSLRGKSGEGMKIIGNWH